MFEDFKHVTEHFHLIECWHGLHVCINGGWDMEFPTPWFCSWILTFPTQSLLKQICSCFWIMDLGNPIIIGSMSRFHHFKQHTFPQSKIGLDLNVEKNAKSLAISFLVSSCLWVVFCPPLLLFALLFLDLLRQANFRV